MDYLKVYFLFCLLGWILEMILNKYKICLKKS